MWWQDGAGPPEGSRKKKRKRGSGGELKELGLTSDDDSDDNEWGTSDDGEDSEGEADFEEDGVAGPMGAILMPSFSISIALESSFSLPNYFPMLQRDENSKGK